MRATATRNVIDFSPTPFFFLLVAWGKNGALFNEGVESREGGIEEQTRKGLCTHAHIEEKEGETTEKQRDQDSSK